MGNNKGIATILIAGLITLCAFGYHEAKLSNQMQGKDFGAFTVYNMNQHASTVVHSNKTRTITVSEHNLLYTVIITQNGGMMIPECYLFEQDVIHPTTSKGMGDLNSFELMELLAFFETKKDVIKNEIFNRVSIKMVDKNASYYADYPIGKALFSGNKMPDFVFTIEQ